MPKKKLDLFDGIGTWKRRPVRASKKTYMPSHKRWGKVTVTKMPVPQGQITSSEIFATPEVQKEPEDVQIPDEPTEVEEKEQE